MEEDLTQELAHLERHEDGLESAAPSSEVSLEPEAEFALIVRPLLRSGDRRPRGASFLVRAFASLKTRKSTSRLWSHISRHGVLLVLARPCLR